MGFWGLCLGLLFLGLEQFKEDDLGTDLSSIAANGLGRVNPTDLLDHECERCATGHWSGDSGNRMVAIGAGPVAGLGRRVDLAFVVRWRHAEI